MGILSPRLREVVDALPLAPGLRVLEIGCGPGAAAREVCRRVGPHGHVLAVDRSPTAIGQAERARAEEIASGRLELRTCSAEQLCLEPGEVLYDLAFAIRVGAFDGRHPQTGDAARERVRAMLRPGGVLLVDGGDPLRDVPLGS